MYDKCMTKQNENRVVDIYNAVSVRSEADSNRCTRFCRPLPSHSAIRPSIRFHPPLPLSHLREKVDCGVSECKYINNSVFCKILINLSSFSAGNCTFFLKNGYLYLDFCLRS